MTKTEMQTEFSRLVNRGIIFGSIWIFGIGSVIAFTSGFQAKKLFEKSDRSLSGKNKIYKCFLIGVVGLLLDLSAVIIIILFRKNN